MRETSKAMTRRAREGALEEKPNGLSPFFWDRVFIGNGLDVGSGDDPLRLEHLPFYPDTVVPTVTHLDLPDGAGDDVTQFVGSNEKFDFVHGSNVCEHFLNPVEAVRSWLKVLKVGGHIVFTVPDFRTYEGLIWPSRWNAGHRSTWSLDIEQSPAPIHCKLPEWMEQFQADVLLCRLVTTNYDVSKNPAEIDQTLRYEDGVECFLEVVARKR